MDEGSPGELKEVPEAPQTQRQGPDHSFRVFFSGSCMAHKLIAGIPPVYITSNRVALCFSFRVLFPQVHLHAVAQTRSPTVGGDACLCKGFAGLGALQQGQEGNESFNLFALAALGLQN